MLALAVLVMSVAAPLVRLATAAALAVAAWRMVFSTALTAAGWAAARHRAPPRAVAPAREWALCGLAGVLLAAHFATWIASLHHTSVSASVVLVNTQPLFAGALATVFLREPLSRRQWLGIVVAVAGAAGILLDGGTGALLGNALATAGALTAAGYYVIGRAVRRDAPLLGYVTRVYGIAAAALVAAAVVAGTPLAGYPAADWAIFAALALGPGLCGHTLLNWALRWLPAPVVNVATLGEPVGASLLAALLPALGEVPGPGTIAGGLVTLAGVAVALGAAPRRTGA